MSASAAVQKAPRRRLPPDERRAQLLAIAIDVFAERGLGAARHAEIAERAGVSVSTVFVYFPTREDLVRDVLDAVAEFFLGLLEHAHSQVAPCADVLRTIGERFLELLKTHRSHVLVWLEWGSAVREDVWPAYRAFTERAVGLTHQTLLRGQREGSVAANADTESLARLFASSSQSIARLQLSDVDPDTIRRFQETLLRAVLLEDAA
jgi:TetR/AcrR family hemagglutinin/protease transcriptional regulator